MEATMGVRPTTMEMRAMMPPVTTAMMASRWPRHSPGGDNTGETRIMLISEIISSVLSNIVEEDERDNSRDKVDDKKNNSSLTDQSDHSSSRLSRDGSGSRDNIVSVTDILTYQVWRQSKNAREILSRNYDLNIDDLFTLLFTNSKFFYDFQAERKTFDIVQCPWKHSDDCEDKYREVSYTLNLNYPVGPKTSRAREVQTMRHNSVPGHIYNVDMETTNADVPYADHFYVSTHYCLVKVSETETFLTVLCDIKYKKTPWGIVKSFIEKNCWVGIDEHFAALSDGNIFY